MKAAFITTCFNNGYEYARGSTAMYPILPRSQGGVTAPGQPILTPRLHGGIPSLPDFPPFLDRRSTANRATDAHYSPCQPTYLILPSSMGLTLAPAARMTL